MTDLLRATVEQASTQSGGRSHLSALYSTIVPTGPGGALPGLRQRLESEMRILRSHPDMPHIIRPTIRPIVTSDVCAPGVLPYLTPEQHASWCLTPAEAAAWYAVARHACEAAASLSTRSLPDHVSRRASNQSSVSWITPERFRRDPRYCARSAIREAGCPMTSPPISSPPVGGHWGGSGISSSRASGQR